MAKNANLNLLVEIGTEELPLSALDLIYAEFESSFAKLLERERIAFGGIEVEATPRRIAFFVEALAPKQSDLSQEISGPSVEKAYDTSGKPTPALLGFMKSKEITEKEIQVRETPKGKFVFGRKELKGKPVEQILPGLVQEVFQTMSFKRGLRWDATGYKFPRPIRWIVATLGNTVLKFKIADVTAGKMSFGHRFLSPKSFSVVKADWQTYHKLLEKQRVILSLEKREALIRDELTKKYGQKSPDEELVHECAQLVEMPFLLEGHFPREYLELPAEVLSTCMKKHQRIFAVYQNGKLQNRFVAVMNGKRDGLKKIAADFEKVLESRLKDARFFFQEDTRQTLESRREKLAQLAYLGNLGSMKDKVERLEKAAPLFCELLGKKELAQNLVRVCSLSKNDLLTQLVFEMPELQGVVGGEYARHQGEKTEVAEAIAKQYLPKNLSESHQNVKKQMSELAALFGVLDRLDLLVGAFGSGIEPTGSQDPFALRRAGGILVKLIRAFNLHFSTSNLIEKITELYASKITKPEGLLKLRKIFLKERVAFELGLKLGMPEYEILQTVVNGFIDKSDNLADVFLRYETILKISIKQPKELAVSATIIQRISNILKGAVKVGDEIRPWTKDLFQQSEENALGQAWEVFKQEFEAEPNLEVANRRYGDVLQRPVHQFFEKVMVNAEDAQIRRNRLALLAEIRGFYVSKIADLSQLSRMDG